MKQIHYIFLFCIIIGGHLSKRVIEHKGTYFIQNSDLNIQNLKQYRITIDNQRISVQGGCNVQNSNFNVQNGVIQFGPWASTMMYCENDHDSEIVALLSQTIRMSSFGDKLLLYRGDGLKPLRLQKI